MNEKIEGYLAESVGQRSSRELAAWQGSHPPPALTAVLYWPQSLAVFLPLPLKSLFLLN
jgi:hypothetical protein